jgi:hypothetical protein
MCAGILLITSSGRLQSSLKIIFRSLYPSIPIEQTGDFTSARVCMADHNPYLVIVDADLLEDFGWKYWYAMMQEFPMHEYFFLIHNIRQSDLARWMGAPSLVVDGMTGVNLANSLAPFFEISYSESQ